MSVEELTNVCRTIDRVLYPEPIPVTIDPEASSAKSGKSAQEFPHGAHCGSGEIRV